MKKGFNKKLSFILVTILMVQIFILSCSTFSTGDVAPDDSTSTEYFCDGTQGFGYESADIHPYSSLSNQIFEADETLNEFDEYDYENITNADSRYATTNIISEPNSYTTAVVQQNYHFNINQQINNIIYIQITWIGYASWPDSSIQHFTQIEVKTESDYESIGTIQNKNQLYTFQKNIASDFERFLDDENNLYIRVCCGVTSLNSEATIKAKHVKIKIITSLLESDDRDLYDIETENNNLDANPGGPYEAKVNSPILFDASDSTGSISSYSWDWDNDGSFDLRESTSAYATHTYTTPGAYTVKLRVENNQGNSNEDTTTVNIISNQPPVANPGGPYEGLVSETINLNASSSYDPDGSILYYYWILPDGEEINVTSSTTSYIFNNALNGNIKLLVYDDEGAESTLASTTITVISENTEIQSAEDLDTADEIVNEEDSDEDENQNFDEDDTQTVLENEDIESYEQFYNMSIKETSDTDIINKGEEKEFELSESKITSIEKIRLIPKVNLTNATITVEKINQRPSYINNDPKPEEIRAEKLYNVQIYKYLNINLTANNIYIKQDEIETMKIRFKVLKLWMTNRDIDSSTIKLMRYHDGKWQNLTTDLIDGNDDNYLFFEAETPGLSTFAVVGGSVVEPDKKTSIESDSSGLSWELIILAIAISFVAILVILIKQKYIYFDK